MFILDEYKWYAIYRLIAIRIEVTKGSGSAVARVSVDSGDDELRLETAGGGVA